MIRVVNNEVKLINLFDFNCEINNLKSFNISELFNHMKMNDLNLEKKIIDQSAQTQMINNSNSVFTLTMLINTLILLKSVMKQIASDFINFKKNVWWSLNDDIWVKVSVSWQHTIHHASKINDDEFDEMMKLQCNNCHNHD